jgi:hypothetical protein
VKGGSKMSHPVLHALFSDKMLEGCCMPLKKKKFNKKFFSSKDVQTHLNGLIYNDLNGNYLDV